MKFQSNHRGGYFHFTPYRCRSGIIYYDVKTYFGNTAGFRIIIKHEI